jgi:hypothetical protein
MRNDERARLRKVLAAGMPSHIADSLAEALIAHQDCCGLRSAALAILEMLELTEASFLQRWAAGEWGA